MRACGELVLRSQLESMLEVLDEHLFLEGPRVDAERARQRAAFLDAPTRPAFLAGRSYDDEPDALAAALAGALRARRTGRDRSARRATSACMASWRPHIDFTRGGPAYAWAYRALAEARDADCFIVLGTAHAGLDGHTLRGDGQGLRDPLRPARGRPGGPGRGRPSRAGRISSRPSSPTGASTPSSFRPCGSSTCWRRAGGGERRIVPLLASFVHECLLRGKSPAGEPGIETVLDALRDAMATIPRRYCIVAGADLAHVGPRFGDEWRADGTQLARVQSEDRALLAPVVAGRRRRASSRRRSDSRTGTGSAACRPSTRSCVSCPAERVGSSTTGSGPIRRARSPSRA